MLPDNMQPKNYPTFPVRCGRGTDGVAAPAEEVEAFFAGQARLRRARWLR